MEQQGVQYIVETEISQAMSNFQTLGSQLKKMGITAEDSKGEFKDLGSSISDTSEEFTEGEKASKKFNKNLGDTEEKAKDATSGVDKFVGSMKNFLGVTAILATGKKVIDMFSEYDNQMNAVEAVSGATALEMEELGTQALKLGADTNYSATQAGEAQEALLRMGNSAKGTKEIVDDVLSFDRANKVGDLAKSSEMLSSSLKMFAMDAKEATRVSDAMSMTTKNSKTTVDYLSTAFNNAGADAKNFGYDIEDTLTLVGAMSNNFADGSSAGTALKGMFADLSTNADKFNKLLGVSVVDNKGKFKQVEVIVKEINQALSNKTPIEQQKLLNAVFGETGKSAYNALAAAGDSIVDLEGKIRNASGTTEKMAEIMDSGLGPKIEGMKGSAETLAITIGQKLNPYLLEGVSSLTSIINVSSDAISNWDEFYKSNQTLIDGVAVLTGGFVTYLGVTKAVALWQGITTSVFSAGTIANTIYTAGIRGMVAYQYAGAGATGALSAAQAVLNSLWLANPIGLTVAGIGALIFGVRYAVSHFSWFREGISKTWQILKDYTPFGVVIKGVEFLTTKFEPLRKIVDGVAGAMKKLFGWKDDNNSQNIESNNKTTKENSHVNKNQSITSVYENLYKCNNQINTTKNLVTDSKLVTTKNVVENIQKNKVETFGKDMTSSLKINSNYDSIKQGIEKTPIIANLGINKMKLNQGVKDIENTSVKQVIDKKVAVEVFTKEKQKVHTGDKYAGVMGNTVTGKKVENKNDIKVTVTVPVTIHEAKKEDAEDIVEKISNRVQMKVKEGILSGAQLAGIL